MVTDGKPFRVLLKLEQNSSLGEFQFFTGGPSQETIVATGGAHLLRISRDKFLEALVNYKEDYEKFCEIKDKLLFEGNLKCIKK